MNAFYYYYFLNKRGVIYPTSEEDFAKETLQYMTSPDTVTEQAAGTLGISSLWLTSVPVVFTRKTFSLYIGSGKLQGNIEPSSDGILIKTVTEDFYKALNRLLSGETLPLETPPARPYALIRAAADMRRQDIADYVRENFKYEDRNVVDRLIRTISLAGAFPPAGSMEICDHGVIEDFAKIEDITIDEAVSGFEVVDENCFINLLLAFKLLVTNFSIQYNKDGSILVSYPGYKLSDFVLSEPSPSNKPERRGSASQPIYGLDFM